MSGQHVCVQCGDTFEHRYELELHWDAEGHGPEAVQKAQVEKARESVRPIESAVVQRRRFHPSRIKHH